MTKEVDSNILQLYQIKKQLGSGAYGHVWKVLDRQTRKQMALKKIFDAFHNDVDAQRTYREITVLHELDHFNIIKLHKVIKAKNNRDLYLVFDYMEADLQSLVGEEILQDVHTRFVIYQIFRALKYLHSAQLIHRDLKPSNILINSECEVKLCDFGLVRSLTHQQEHYMILTQQVATRWYRSPQILLGSTNYGKQTDIWSVGCIIAELLIGQPLFPGDSTINQLERILQFTGIPSKHQIDSLQSQMAQSLINQLSINRKSFQDYFKKSNFKKMLQFNPKKRITIQQALQLDIFTEFRTHKFHQDICTKFIITELDDNKRLCVQKYRKMIYQDIQRRYPDINLNNSKSLQRPFQKQSKRLTRSHHSVNRKRSSDQFKALNSSGNLNQQSKKQSSVSFHQGDNIQKIKKMKNQWKKNENNNLCHTSQHDQISKVYTNIQSFYKGSTKGTLTKDSSVLTKVRSRKILNRIKSRQKIQNNRPPCIIQKKRHIR